MPTYSGASADLVTNFFNYTLQGGITFGTATIPSTLPSVTIPAISLSYLDAGGVGTFNRIAHVSGILTNVTPGTTDTANVDLKALNDPYGVAFTDLTKLIGILTVNLANDNVSYLTFGPGATNGLSSLFSGTGGLLIGPGHTSPVDGQPKPGVFFVLSANVAAYAVSSTIKTVKYTSGSSTSLPYRSVFIGRTV